MADPQKPYDPLEPYDPAAWARELDAPAAAPRSADQNTGLLSDYGTDIKRGLLQLPGAATGLADILVQGALGAPRAVLEGASALTGDDTYHQASQALNQPWVSKGAEALGDYTGLDFGKRAERAQQEYSPERQAAKAEVDQAWEEGGAGNIAGAYLSNPLHTIGGLVAESLPATVAGGFLGRGIAALAQTSRVLAAAPTLSKYLSPTTLGGKGFAFGAGEGAVAAGMHMEEATSQGAPADITALTGLGVLGTTGALGVLGGKIANKMGIGDIEQAMAGAARGEAATSGLAGKLAEAAMQPTWAGRGTRVGFGALSEGLLEEAPQSAFEQIWQNVATGQDLTTDLARASVEGALAGAGMGGGYNAFTSGRPAVPPAVPPAPAVTPTAGAVPPVPPVTPEIDLTNPTPPTPGVKPNGQETNAVPAEEVRPAEGQGQAQPLRPEGANDDGQGGQGKEALLGQAQRDAEAAAAATDDIKRRAVYDKARKAQELSKKSTRLYGDDAARARENSDLNTVELTGKRIGVKVVGVRDPATDTWLGQPPAPEVTPNALPVPGRPKAPPAAPGENPAAQAAAQAAAERPPGAAPGAEVPTAEELTNDALEDTPAGTPDGRVQSLVGPEVGQDQGSNVPPAEGREGVQPSGPESQAPVEVKVAEPRTPQEIVRRAVADNQTVRDMRADPKSEALVDYLTDFFFGHWNDPEAATLRSVERDPVFQRLAKSKQTRKGGQSYPTGESVRKAFHAVKAALANDPTLQAAFTARAAAVQVARHSGEAPEENIGPALPASSLTAPINEDLGDAQHGQGRAGMTFRKESDLPTDEAAALVERNAALKAQREQVAREKWGSAQAMRKKARGYDALTGWDELPQDAKDIVLDSIGTLDRPRAEVSDKEFNDAVSNFKKTVLAHEVAAPKAAFVPGVPSAAQAANAVKRAGAARKKGIVEAADTSEPEADVEPESDVGEDGQASEGTPTLTSTTLGAAQAVVDRLVGNNPAAKRRIVLAENVLDERVPPQAFEAAWLASKSGKQLRGWIQTTNGQQTIYLFYGNTPLSAIPAVLMHELTHASDATMRRFAKRIKKFAASKTDSPEQRIARAALERVASANPAREAVDSEIIAYFVEEAIRAGIDPVTGAGATPQARSLLREMWRWVQGMLRKLGIYNTSHMQTGDIVALVHSLAQTATFETQKHGAARAVVDGKATFDGQGNPQTETPEFKRWSRGMPVYEDATQYQAGQASVGPNQPPVNLSPSSILADNWWEQSKAWTAEQTRGFWQRHGFALYTDPQLNERHGTEGSRKVATILDAITFAATRRIQEAAQLDNRWVQLPKVQADLVSHVLHEGRRLGINPANIEKYQDQAQWALLSPEKQKALLKQWKLSTPADKAKLLAQWKALTPEAKAIHQAALDYYKNSLLAKKAILEEVRDQVRKANANAKSDEIDMVLKTFENAIESAEGAAEEGTYTPFIRVGDFHVIGMSPEMAALEAHREAHQKDPVNNAWTPENTKRRDAMRQDPNHYVVQGATSVADMQKKHRALVAKFGKFGVQSMQNKVHSSMLSTANLTAISKYRATLENTVVQDAQGNTKSAMDAAAIDAAVFALQKMMIELLPEGHQLKRTLKAELTPGEEPDARAVFAQVARSDAHYMARLEHANELSEAMAKMQRVSNTIPAANAPGLTDDERTKILRDAEDARAVANEFARRANQTMSEPSPTANWLLNWSFFDHLGGSAAFLLMNAHQPWTVTLPVLAARFQGHYETPEQAANGMRIESLTRDLKKVGEALWRHSKAAAKMLTFTKTGTAGQIATAQAEARVSIDTAKLLEEAAKIQDPDARAKREQQVHFLEHLTRTQLLDITLEHNLGTSADTRLQTLGRAIRTISMPVQAGEMINRAASGLAAFELGLEKFSGAPDQVAQATAFAEKIVRDTQIDYSSGHTARAMRSVLGSQPLARIVFQFWKYRQGMLFLTFSSLKDGWLDKDGGLDANAPEGEKEAARQAARRAFAGLYATTMLTAGIFEGPLIAGGLGALSMLAGLGGDDDDPPVDLQRNIRNWMADIDPLLGEVASKGLWSLAGIDMSKRLGMGDLANPLAFARFTGQSGRDDAAAALSAAAGAPFSTVADTWDGVTKIARGDVREGIQQIVPLKGASDLMRAWGLGTEGLQTKTGEQIKGPESFSAADVIARAGGAQPLAMSRYYEGNAAVQAVKKAATEARKGIIAEYAQARRRGEPSADAMRAVKDYNAKHPEKGLRITTETLLKAVQERAKIEKQRGDAGVLRSPQNKPFLEYGRFAEVD